VSPATFWLGRLAAGCGATLLVALVMTCFGSHDAPVRVRFAAHAGVLERRLRFLRLPITGKQVLAAQAVLGAGSLALALVLREVWLTLPLPLVIVLPKAFLDQRAARRTTQVEAQLEGWLGAIANALKASASLGEAVAASVLLVPAPMSEEVALLVKEYELGAPLDDAVQRFAERVPSKAVEGAVLALKVARRSGGDLPQMLENASVALRELARLEGVVRSKTAEGKAQAVVIGLIPIPMVLGVRWSDEHFFDALLATFIGHLVIGGAVALWFCAILLARKILAVDV
jgi:tight adherence protein B